MTWHRVGAPADFPEGALREVRLGDLVLAVGRWRGRLFAIHDWCPHAGASLAAGTLEDGFVVCPLHGYAYDVFSGRCEDDAAPVPRREVREGDGTVEIDL